MPELRWTLLILGALFVVGLALWEFRRQRQAPRQNLSAGGSSGDGPMEVGRFHREPTISLPELHPEPRVEPLVTPRAREPAHDPPVVEVDSASFSRLQAQSEAPPEPADDPDDFTIADDADTVNVRALAPTEPDAAHDPAAARSSATRAASQSVPTIAAAAGAASSHDEAAGHRARSSASWGASQSVPTIAASAGAPTSHVEAAGHGAGNFAPSESSTGFVSDSDHDESEQPTPREHHPVGATAGSPIVDWPREESRKIVALRLVSAPAARFPGRAVRQALAAEGFVLGKFDIFHKAGPDDRAMLSAASLTKPGTFALGTIDAQRFGGISLFAVLPGPLPAQQTFDELLVTARNLNDRLQGALQDERGEPLTPTRSASIRQSLSEGRGLSEGKEIGAGTVPHPETRQ